MTRYYPSERMADPDPQVVALMRNAMRSVWIVVHAQTGEPLCRGSRVAEIGKLSFRPMGDDAYPMMFPEERAARKAFDAWCVEQGHLRRRITLPGQATRYQTGAIPPPPTVIVRIGLVPEVQALPPRQGVGRWK